MKIIDVPTGDRTQMLDVTGRVQAVIDDAGFHDGLCCLWVPHTTAGITVNENADPSVTRDMLYETNKVIPFEDGYHHGEGNSAAHIKSSLYGPSLVCLVENGDLVLGTWQAIYFCEFDGPRRRRLFVKLVGQ